MALGACAAVVLHDQRRAAAAAANTMNLVRLPGACADRQIDDRRQWLHANQQQSSQKSKSVDEIAMIIVDVPTAFRAYPRQLCKRQNHQCAHRHWD